MASVSLAKDAFRSSTVSKSLSCSALKTEFVASVRVVSSAKSVTSALTST